MNFTVETCHQLDPWALLLWACDQVLNQGELSSAAHSGCQYKMYSDNDPSKVLKCGVGHCIVPADYSYSFECHPVNKGLFTKNMNDSPSKRLLYDALSRFTDLQKNALIAVQRIHDTSGTFDVFQDRVRRLKDMKHPLPDEPIGKLIPIDMFSAPTSSKPYAFTGHDYFI